MFNQSLLPNPTPSVSEALMWICFIVFLSTRYLWRKLVLFLVVFFLRTFPSLFFLIAGFSFVFYPEFILEKKACFRLFIPIYDPPSLMPTLSPPGRLLFPRSFPSRRGDWMDCNCAPFTVVATPTFFCFLRVSVVWSPKQYSFLFSGRPMNYLR